VTLHSPSGIGCVLVGPLAARQTLAGASRTSSREVLRPSSAPSSKSSLPGNRSAIRPSRWVSSWHGARSPEGERWRASADHDAASSPPAQQPTSRSSLKEALAIQSRSGAAGPCPGTLRDRPRWFPRRGFPHPLRSVFTVSRGLDGLHLSEPSGVFQPVTLLEFGYRQEDRQMARERPTLGSAFPLSLVLCSHHRTVDRRGDPASGPFPVEPGRGPCTPRSVVHPVGSALCRMLSQPTRPAFLYR
jgi:hypothetical protein